MHEQTDTKVIISLMMAEKAERELRQRSVDSSTEVRQKQYDANMEHLHECVHGIGESVKLSVAVVQRMGTYFVGLSPAEHVKDHFKLVDLSHFMKDIAELKSTLKSVEVLTKELVEVRKELAEVRKDLEAIKADKSMVKGGWWVLGLVGTFAMAALSAWKSLHG